MKRHILLCGLASGLLSALLHWAEYRLVVMDHAVEIYSALIAAVFAALGIFLGLRLTGRSAQTGERQASSPAPVPAAGPLFASSLAPSPVPPLAPQPADQGPCPGLGITPRELEILGLIAQGMSNREIAGKLFVSENTVKTHCSRAFDKLGARRRTEAILLGKHYGLLP